jgi:hypothetical protein
VFGRKMIALPLATGCGEAQEMGQPGRGLALAVLASVPGMTAIALSAALNTSHRSANTMLKADEQADIIAYILNLR